MTLVPLKVSQRSQVSGVEVGQAFVGDLGVIEVEPLEAGQAGQVAEPASGWWCLTGRVPAAGQMADLCQGVIVHIVQKQGLQVIGLSCSRKVIPRLAVPTQIKAQCLVQRYFAGAFGEPSFCQSR